MHRNSSSKKCTSAEEENYRKYRKHNLDDSVAFVSETIIESIDALQEALNATWSEDAYEKGRLPEQNLSLETQNETLLKPEKKICPSFNTNQDCIIAKRRSLERSSEDLGFHRTVRPACDPEISINMIEGKDFNARRSSYKKPNLFVGNDLGDNQSEQDLDERYSPKSMPTNLMASPPSAARHKKKPKKKRLHNRESRIDSVFQSCSPIRFKNVSIDQNQRKDSDDSETIEKNSTECTDNMKDSEAIEYIDRKTTSLQNSNMDDKVVRNSDYCRLSFIESDKSSMSDVCIQQVEIARSKTRFKSTISSINTECTKEGTESTKEKIQTEDVEEQTQTADVEEKIETKDTEEQIETEDTEEHIETEDTEEKIQNQDDEEEETHAGSNEFLNLEEHDSSATFVSQRDPPIWTRSMTTKALKKYFPCESCRGLIENKHVCFSIHELIRSHAELNEFLIREKESVIGRCQILEGNKEIQKCPNSDKIFRLGKYCSRMLPVETLPVNSDRDDERLLSGWTQAMTVDLLRRYFPCNSCRGLIENNHMCFRLGELVRSHITLNSFVREENEHLENLRRNSGSQTDRVFLRHVGRPIDCKSSCTRCGNRKVENRVIECSKNNNDAIMEAGSCRRNSISNIKQRLDSKCWRNNGRYWKHGTSRHCQNFQLSCECSLLPHDWDLSILLQLLNFTIIAGTVVLFLWR